MSLEQLQTFLGWCTVINYAVLIFTTLLLVVFKKQIKSLHSIFFQLSPEKLESLYFKFLAYYKMLVIIFNLVPYVALRLI
jgi:hypothetical protein